MDGHTDTRQPEQRVTNSNDGTQITFTLDVPNATIISDGINNWFVAPPGVNTLDGVISVSGGQSLQPGSYIISLDTAVYIG